MKRSGVPWRAATVGVARKFLVSCINNFGMDGKKIYFCANPHSPMKTKSIFAMMLSLSLVLGACNEKDKQEPDNSGNNSQSGQEETPSFDGDEGAVDGHAWVNLGLPSGTLWATCNVGANSPEEYGDYFAWGETQPKSSYTSDNLKYYTGFDEHTDSETYSKYTGSDGKTELDPDDDVATANWGNYWRMPNIGDVEELYNKCTRVWTSQGGINGRLFTGPNGNTLFLPAAGCYDESTLDGDGLYGVYMSNTRFTDYPCAVHGLYFDSNYEKGDFDLLRYTGLSVRPVVRR